MEMTVDERNKWIIKNERFIHSVCQKYRYRYDYDDIIQEAFVGAMAALDRIWGDKDDKAIRAYVSAYIDGYVRNNEFSGSHKMGNIWHAFLNFARFGYKKHDSDAHKVIDNSIIHIVRRQSSCMRDR